MNDVMALLAEANPVRAEDLAPLEVQNLSRRSAPSRRLVASVVLAALAASLISVFLVDVTSSHRGASGTQGPTGARRAGSNGPPPPTVDRPLPSGTRVTLAEAAVAIGQTVVLPDTRLVRPADVGPIWAWSHDTRANVAVTYPARHLFVEYERPLPFLDPLTAYTGWSKEWFPSSHVIRLGRIPAAWMNGNDGTGNNDVNFQINDLGIRITGPYGEATLRSIAQSIVDRSPPPNDPGNNLLPSAPSPKTPVAIGEASKVLGAAIVLPARALVPWPPHAWMAGQCPRGGRHRCLIWVRLPTLTVLYEHPSPWPRSEYRQLVKMSPRFRLVDLGGSPALVIPKNWKNGKIPGSVDFIVGGVRIVVSGHYGPTGMQAIAQSIVDRSK